MKHLLSFPLFEGKNVADLYHFTTLDGLHGIIQQGIKFSTREYERENQEKWWKNRLSKFNDSYSKYISTTRHATVGKILNGMNEMQVRILLDAPSITNTYKIVPIDFIAQTHDYENSTPKTRGDFGTSSGIAANSFEERIISPKKDSIDEYLSIKYIKMVDIFYMDDKGNPHRDSEMEGLKMQLEEKGIPHRIQASYPKAVAKYKSTYQLGKLKCMDGISLNRLSPAVRSILSNLIAKLVSLVGTDDIVANLSEDGADYELNVMADLPMYKSNTDLNELLYHCIITNNGTVRDHEYNYDNISTFKKKLETPYFFDDYMNDKGILYLGRSIAAEFEYTSDYDTKEAAISNLIVNNEKAFVKALPDIIETIVPREGSLDLPDTMIKYAPIQFHESEYLMDPDNPHRVIYKAYNL